MTNEKFKGRLVTLSALAFVLFVGASRCHARKRECRALPKPNYELYGTKTLYQRALDTLNEAATGAEGGIKLPSSFSNESLRDVHNELEHHGCEPIVLYLMSRHAARYPDGDDIEARNKLALRLQRHVEKLAASEARNSSCLVRRLSNIRKWRATMSAEQDNLTTKKGHDEQRELGKRMRDLYPDLLDARKSDITVRTTDKLRTVQTARAFLESGVAHLDMQQLLNASGTLHSRSQSRRSGKKLCPLDSLPDDDVTDDDYSVDKIRNNTCYRLMTKAFKSDLLAFHDACEKMALASGKQLKKLQNSKAKQLEQQIMGPISERVNQRLAFPNTTITSSGDQSTPIDDKRLSVDEVSELYELCKFEQANGQQDSVWCMLFTRAELALLEYVEDADDYLNDAHALEHNSQISCPLIRDIVEKVSAPISGTDDENKQQQQRGHSYLYFSHAGAAKRAVTALGLFIDPDSYSNETIERVLADASQVPLEREWRSSLVAPFSATVTLVVYNCPAVHPKSPKRSGSQSQSHAHSHSHAHHSAIVDNTDNTENIRHKRAHPSGFKLVAAVTERAVILPGCEGPVCALDKFISYHKSTAENCDIEQVCRRLQQ